MAQEIKEVEVKFWELASCVFLLPKQNSGNGKMSFPSNATFRLKDEAHAEAFDVAWKAAKINGLKGHRSVGGYRASMYNALPLKSVQVLVDVMAAFERSHG